MKIKNAIYSFTYMGGEMIYIGNRKMLFFIFNIL